MSEHEAQKSKAAGLSPLLVLLILGAAAAIVIVAALAFVNQRGQPDATAQMQGGAAVIGENLFSTGVNVLDPTPVTPFTLTRTDGSVLTLDTLKGKYSVLYFGYTYCPDFCPSTMTDWRLVRRGLGELAARVNFVMVSVDPERDTPDVLTRYLNTFDAAIIGATGDDTTLRRMGDEFGIFYNAVGQGESALYTVEHTPSQIVIDPAGNVVTIYTFGTPIDVITADLRAKLQAQ